MPRLTKEQMDILRMRNVPFLGGTRWEKRPEPRADPSVIMMTEEVRYRSRHNPAAAPRTAGMTRQVAQTWLDSHPRAAEDMPASPAPVQASLSILAAAAVVPTAPAESLDSESEGSESEESGSQGSQNSDAKDSEDEDSVQVVEDGAQPEVRRRSARLSMGSAMGPQSPAASKIPPTAKELKAREKASKAKAKKAAKAAKDAAKEAEAAAKAAAKEKKEQSLLDSSRWSKKATARLVWAIVTKKEAFLERDSKPVPRWCSDSREKKKSVNVWDAEIAPVFNKRGAEGTDGEACLLVEQA